MNSSYNATVGEKRMANRSRKKRPSKSTSAVFVVMGLICAAISYWSVENLDTVQRLISSAMKLQITSFSLAKAVEAAKPAGKKGSETNVKKEEKSSQEKRTVKAGESETKKSWSEEEIRVFSKLEERKKELDDREVELQKLEEELQQQRVMLEDKIKELEKMRQSVAVLLKDRTVSDSEKVDRLVEFYSNMKPQNAAKIFEEINENLAVEILSRLKKKNAADIMNLIKPDKAQRLSEKYAGYRK